jgi:hypothetical protein
MSASLAPGVKILEFFVKFIWFRSSPQLLRRLDGSITCHDYGIADRVAHPASRMHLA